MPIPLVGPRDRADRRVATVPATLNRGVRFVCSPGSRTSSPAETPDSRQGPSRGIRIAMRSVCWPGAHHRTLGIGTEGGLVVVSTSRWRLRRREPVRAGFDRRPRPGRSVTQVVHENEAPARRSARPTTRGRALVWSVVTVPLSIAPVVALCCLSTASSGAAAGMPAVRQRRDRQDRSRQQRALPSRPGAPSSTTLPLPKRAS